MKVTTARAPSLHALRPARDQPRTATFPVYDDIADVLDEPDPDPGTPLASNRLAHVMATCSAYAYGDALTFATIAARLGLEDNRCVEISQEVDALLITSTAFLAQSADGSRVIVAYRGTRPTGVADILGDADTYPDKLRIPSGPLAGKLVHSGFYRNVRSTRAEVLHALEGALHGHPIDDVPAPREDGSPPAPGPLEPMTSLHLTGHSLGGAMALFLAVLLADEADFDARRAAIARTLRTVHTFGQPMIGSPGFAAAAGDLAWPGRGGGRLADHVLRWVHRDDIVATYPSTASGPYAHLGRERRFRRGAWQPEGPVSTQMSGVLGFAMIPLSLLTRTFVLPRALWFGPSLDDHFPERYVRRLAPDRVPSEYGD